LHQLTKDALVVRITSSAADGSPATVAYNSPISRATGRIGILAGGGDAPGLNSVIKYVVYRSADQGLHRLEERFGLQPETEFYGRLRARIEAAQRRLAEARERGDLQPHETGLHTKACRPAIDGSLRNPRQERTRAGLNSTGTSIMKPICHRI
jgi:hypothetical protein